MPTCQAGIQPQHGQGLAPGAAGLGGPAAESKGYILAQHLQAQVQPLQPGQPAVLLGQHAAVAPHKGAEAQAQVVDQPHRVPCRQAGMRRGPLPTGSPAGRHAGDQAGGQAAHPVTVSLLPTLQTRGTGHPCLVTDGASKGF